MLKCFEVGDRSVHNKPMLWKIEKNEGSMVVCTEIKLGVRMSALSDALALIRGPGYDPNF